VDGRTQSAAVTKRDVQYRCAERENDCAGKRGYSDSVVGGTNLDPNPANVRQKKRKRFGRGQITEPGPEALAYTIMHESDRGIGGGASAVPRHADPHRARVQSNYANSHPPSAVESESFPKQFTKFCGLNH
jgi:hypothetical protein